MLWNSCIFASRIYRNITNTFSRQRQRFAKGIAGNRVGIKFGHNCPSSIIQLAVAEVLEQTSDLQVYEDNMHSIKFGRIGCLFAVENNFSVRLVGNNVNINRTRGRGTHLCAAFF